MASAKPLLRSMLAAGVLLCLGRTAHAGLAHPYSWTLSSPDGQYLLVMISPLPIEQDARDSMTGRFAADNIRSIRAKYAESGLYRNDGSTEPLWTLPYYTWRHEFYIAADGKHLVIADTDWFYTDNVATFLCEGRVLKRHGLTELIPLNLLRITSFVCRTPPSGESSRFDEQSMTYTLTTNHGETFVFDVATGELQLHTSYLPLIGSLLLAVLIVLPCGGFWWWYRRSRL